MATHLTLVRTTSGSRELGSEPQEECFVCSCEDDDPLDKARSDPPGPGSLPARPTSWLPSVSISSSM